MHALLADSGPLPANALAAATTIHVLLALVAWHRGRGAVRLAPALVLAGAPWLLSTAGWVVAGLSAHVALLVAPGGDATPGGATVPAARAPEPAGGVEDAALPPAPPAAHGARGFTRVPLLAVLDETPDIRTFRMERPVGLSFRAGQYLAVRVPADGRPVTRCYSISSSPAIPGYLEISVKRQGLVSGFLHATARPGGTLEVRGPGGDFVLPGNDALPLVLVAGGVGITPLRSMLLHTLASEPSRRVTLLYSVRTERDIAFRDELVSLAGRHPQLRLAIAVSGGTARPGLWPGRVDRRLVESAVGDVRNALFMLCGPLPMIDALRALLREMGAPPSRIRSEAFAAAVAGAAEPEPAATARLTLTRTGRTVCVAPRQSLLEAAESAGSAIESLCRAGSCGTCRTRLVSGRVEGGVDGGWIQPCVTYAREDCALEA